MIRGRREKKEQIEETEIEREEVYRIIREIKERKVMERNGI